ncbi:MAG: ABC transporter permease [Methanobacteriota archaeon]|nr:MAG: ABC transporter permease [Euryarchaeota archaeon]
MKEARHSLRLLRKSPLAMLGLGIVVFFLFLAIFGQLLAPYAYYYNPGERNSAPLTRPLVPANESARAFSGSGWTNLQNLAREDDEYATSKTVGDTLILRRFDFDVSVYTEYITSVGLWIQSNSTLGEAGSYVNISVSWDNGVNWSAPTPTPLRFSDLDKAWFFYDFTNVAPWNSTTLSKFAVRLVHELDPRYSPSSPRGVGVDVLLAVVRFHGYYHILGTTESGEDVLTGVLLGARISIRIGLLVVGLTVLIGAFLGAFSGYFGGPMDELIMRVTDIFLSIPGLILALAVASALGRSLDNVMLALVVVSWPVYTRLVRGQALSVRENAFIEAARASGANDFQIVVRHILPNTRAPILVQASLDVGTIVLVAAGLSFLGLGAQPGTPEWGLMVSKGFSFFPQNWWEVSFAGLMIFLFTLGFNLLGDGARDILDPRLRR